MSRLMETFTIGGMPITALSDGAPDRALGGFFNNVDPAAWTAALGINSPEDLVPFNFGVFLLRTPSVDGGIHTVLIDSGYGPPVGAMGILGGAGLLDRLGEAGVRADEVTDIIHTHLHGDHCGWNVVEGKLTFPNATIRVARKELDHWLDPAGSGERFDIARSQTVPVQAAGHLETFSGDGEILPGLTAIPTPGHTPGHTSIMVSAGNEHLLITGDAAHHPVHFEHHDWIPAVDLDPAESTRSRGKLAALAADRDAVVTGGHFPILTLGHVRRVEGGYRWEGIKRPNE